jgi:PAS domain S-box-containing protein
MSIALVVDDKAENVYLLHTLLKANGFEVMTASNGREALESARRRPPDILITDILMPVMDGFSLCRQWKKDALLRAIPFIFYTATYTDPKDEEFALSLGADLFVTKPKDPEVLLKLAIDLLEKNRAGAVPSNPAPAPEETVYLKEYNQTLIRKLEAKVLELEEANKALAVKDFAIASAISGILLVSPEKRLTYVNTSCATMWGYRSDELVGTQVEILLSRVEDVTRLAAALRAEGSWIGELEARRKDGTTFIAQLTAHRVLDPQGVMQCVMVSCLDVTEQKRMREELQRSQRMESLSLFAAGIAHDFNNLLTGLFVGIELIRKELPPRTPGQEYLAVVMSVFSRARDLAHHLLAFAKGGSPVRKKLNASVVVKESCALSLSGSRIQHNVVVDKNLWLIEADANQLSQVFNNIIINARQAMDDHGTMDITVRNCPAPEGGDGALPPGEYVEIHFKNDGPGIPSDVLPRIFDPFFTTKKEGSGLGLATSYAIIKNHGGHINAASPPGHGVSFRVWLPALREAIEERSKEVPPEETAGEGRVLLMDDEESICKLAKAILIKAGYRVSTASNGQEALRAYRQAVASRQPFDLAILDLTIRGGMGGEETLAELRTVNPHIAAIASSGYSDAVVLSRMKELGFLGVLPKPYLAHELLSTVKAMTTPRRASTL